METKNVWIVSIISLLIVAMVIGGVLYSQGKTTALSVIPTGGYDGEFDEFGLPEEVTGTGLIANTSYAEDSEAFTVDFESYTNINATAGVTYQLGARMEISGNMENFEADVALGDALVTEFELTKFYVLEDTEGVILDIGDAVYVGTIDSDKDEAELKIASLTSGDYVVVVEGRTLPTVSALTSGESILTIEFDADSDDSDAVDEGTLTIYNYIA